MLFNPTNTRPWYIDRAVAPPFARYAAPLSDERPPQRPFDVLWLKMLVKVLVLPPNGPLLLVVAGLALAGRWPRLGRRMAVAELMREIGQPIEGASERRRSARLVR